MNKHTIIGRSINSRLIVVDIMVAVCITHICDLFPLSIEYLLYETCNVCNNYKVSFTSTCQFLKVIIMSEIFLR